MNLNLNMVLLELQSVEFHINLNFQSLNTLTRNLRSLEVWIHVLITTQALVRPEIYFFSRFHSIYIKYVKNSCQWKSFLPNTCIFVLLKSRCVEHAWQLYGPGYPHLFLVKYLNNDWNRHPYSMYNVHACICCSCPAALTIMTGKFT